MKKCRFCCSEKEITKIKLCGFKPIRVCPECRRHLENALANGNESLNYCIRQYEQDFSIPRDLINFLYILPLYKKGKALKSKVIKYSKNNKPEQLTHLGYYLKSNLFDSILAQVGLFILLCFAPLLFEFIEIQLTVLFFIFYYLGAAVFSFLTGIVILRTGYTDIPCRKIWGFTSYPIKYLAQHYKNIYWIRVKNRTVNLLLVFIRIPLYIIFTIIIFICAVISAVIYALVAYIHALFLFVPAYAVDYRRRKTK